MALEVFFNGSDKSDHVERRLRRQSDARRSSSCELVKPSPNVRRKKLDRRKHPCSFFGPRCSFTGASDSACLSRCRSRASSRSRRQTQETSRHCCGSSMIPMNSAVVPQIWHSPCFIVPRRSAVASFARAESAARVASSRRAAASRRRVVSSSAWRSR